MLAMKPLYVPVLEAGLGIAFFKLLLETHYVVTARTESIGWEPESWTNSHAVKKKLLSQNIRVIGPLTILSSLNKHHLFTIVRYSSLQMADQGISQPP